MPGSDPAAGAAFPPGEAAAGFELRLFGPMEVRIGGAPMARLRSRKGLWLLALLVLRAGRDVERDWLAGTLWPEHDEAHARRSLRQSLHDLRLALGPESTRLACEAPRTLRLDLAAADVDVLAFDRAAARGDLPSLETAVRLCRGPVLEDCAEEWVQEERRAREEAYFAALGKLAEAAAERHDHAAAAGYLRLAVSTDPFREEFQRSLMEALDESGNPAGALLVYRQYQTLLAREMAAEPAEETTALFRRVRDDSRSRAAVRPVAAVNRRARPEGPGAVRARPLPAPLTPLVGREEDTREVIARLAAARLVTLTGTGGVGKTRLALRAAEEVAADFPDGACFVSLAALTDAERIPDAVRTALGIPPPDPSATALDTLLDHLAQRRLLLVIDNCEHLLDGSTRMAVALLEGCPELRVLATSRQALGVPGEVVWRVPSLLGPEAARPGAGAGGLSMRPPHPATLAQYPAVRLFLERARAAGAALELTPRNAAAITEVCLRLDGIPLALELAAARAPALPIEEIAARLHDRFRLLTGGSRAALPRHQTLRAALDWSYDLLTEPERALMRQLSVFAGGWTLDAAEAVCGECGWRMADGGIGNADPSRAVSSDPTRRVVRGPLPSEFPNPPSAIRHPQSEQSAINLTGLVEKSLVVFEEWETGGRYRMLETVRLYFRERLEASGEEEAVRGRHLEYFTRLAEEAAPHLTGDRQGEWLDRLETEHDNFRAALSWAATAPASGAGADPSDTKRAPARLGLRLGIALGHFWLVRGYLAEGREWLAQVLAASPPDGPRRGGAVNAAGNLAFRQGDYGAAQALYEESLAITRAEGDRVGIAASLNNAGMVAYVRGDYPAARAFYEESLALRRETGDPWDIAASLNNLGAVAYLLKDYETARALYEESLALRRKIGDRWVIAGSLNNLGLVACDLGDFAAARNLLRESLALRCDLEDRVGVAGSLEGLATVACREGGASAESARAAARLFAAAESLREALGAPAPPGEQEDNRRLLAGAREALDETAFSAAWAEGRAMDWAQAVEYGLGEDSGTTAAPVS